jgi:hypothetical protein
MSVGTERPNKRRSRSFGRQYLVRWNGEKSGYEIMLGQEALGFHASRDGAFAVVTWHARQETLPNGAVPNVMTVAADGSVAIGPLQSPK